MAVPETTLIHKRHIPFSIILSLAISACSSVDNAERALSCGKQIQPDDVRILDLRPLGDQPDRVSDIVTDKVGAYQLITTQPMGIPVGGARCSNFDCIEADTAINGIEGIGNARNEAAMRGCNLLLALDLKLVPPKEGGYSISKSSGTPTGRWAWIVHLGMRED